MPRIKCIYVGSTKVRPGNSIIESDFTTATWSSLQAQGWSNILTTSNRGYILDSNGLRPNGSSNDTFANIYYPLSASQRQGMKKISINMQGYGNRGSWSAGTGCTIKDQVSMSGQNYVNAGNSFNTNSGYRGQNINYNGSKVAGSEIQLDSGNYEVQFTYNYETGLCTYILFVNGTQKQNTSYTFNATQMGNIANYSIIELGSGRGIKYGNGNTVTYCKIEIEK